MPFETENSDLFLNILTKLYESGALDSLMLIGGWCLHFYQLYFENNPDVPVLRTFDVDFLVPRPPKIKKEVDIPTILEELGFDREYSMLGECDKYVNPDMEVEFLVPEFGKGGEPSLAIPKLHIKAVQLRYLNLLQAHPLKLEYHNLSVTVPEPAAFALHKYILSSIRHKTSLKPEKDFETAQELSSFLLSRNDQRLKLKMVYAGMLKKWQKKLNSIIQDSHQELAEFLLS